MFHLLVSSLNSLVPVVPVVPVVLVPVVLNLFGCVDSFLRIFIFNIQSGGQCQESAGADGQQDRSSFTNQNDRQVLYQSGKCKIKNEYSPFNHCPRNRRNDLWWYERSISHQMCHKQTM